MFTDTLTRWLDGVSEVRFRGFLRAILAPLVDRQSSVCVTNATLAIKAGASALVKNTEPVYGFSNGVPWVIADNTDMAALSGTVTADAFNVYCFFIDSAGTLTSAMGTEGATYAAVKFPQFPVQKALLGWVVINPTGTGNFVGGTTALDDATVVPTAVYVNAVAGFDPHVIIGGL